MTANLHLASFVRVITGLMPLAGGLPPLPNLPNLNLPLPDLSSMSLPGGSTGKCLYFLNQHDITRFYSNAVSFPLLPPLVPPLVSLPPLNIPGLAPLPSLPTMLPSQLPPVLPQMPPLLPISTAAPTASVTVTTSKEAAAAEPALPTEAASTHTGESSVPTETTRTS